MTWEFTSSREQETPLTPEQRKIVEDHLGLAGYVMNRLYRRSGQEDLYEDLLQICKYGLVKAAKDWDAQSGGSFPAFAITIMKAQYYRYFSYKGMKKRSAEVLSYDQPVEGEEGDSATHLDAFSDSFCLVDHVEDSLFYQELLKCDPELVALILEGNTKEEIIDYLRISLNEYRDRINKLKDLIKYSLVDWGIEIPLPFKLSVDWSRSKEDSGSELKDLLTYEIYEQLRELNVTNEDIQTQFQIGVGTWHRLKAKFSLEYELRHGNPERIKSFEYMRSLGDCQLTCEIFANLKSRDIQDLDICTHFEISKDTLDRQKRKWKKEKPELFVDRKREEGIAYMNQLEASEITYHLYRDLLQRGVKEADMLKHFGLKKDRLRTLKEKWKMEHAEFDEANYETRKKGIELMERLGEKNLTFSLYEKLKDEGVMDVDIINYFNVGGKYELYCLKQTWRIEQKLHPERYREVAINPWSC